ncbi:MAG TPA: nicotinate-nucleotide adenylyltransferase [Baekduia sp.]|uniref:nicotinate-nucleotide adenylyltransferase n=1 Tax=Baekduia sp. TaxID=2600305 RepID=UPI002B6F3921|nr:nicotinate-nucleotide adenylyltransferase [Baekduia sp.]HMJ32485.1 nicotinate-nucleotide adenylyltransferase [Baekduia sp.]
MGVLGGTFNPPHVAHLLSAQEAYDQLGLDRVLIIPVALPPHKDAEGDPGAHVRLELCRLAASHDDRFEVSDLEVRRGGASYTVDTLRALHATFPGDELSFIVGGDMAFSLPTWREPAEVVGLARLAVAEREGARQADILERLATIPSAADRVDFFDLPRMDVSSSLVRRRVATGRPIRYLVPDPVAEYIAQHGLYRSPVGAPTSSA